MAKNNNGQDPTNPSTLYGGATLRNYKDRVGNDKPSERQQRLHLLDVVTTSLLATGIEEQVRVAVKNYPDHPLHFSFRGGVENEDPNEPPPTGQYRPVHLYTLLEVEKLVWPNPRAGAPREPHMVSVWIVKNIADTTRDYQLAALESAPELYNKLRAKNQRLTEAKSAAKSAVTDMVAQILRDLQAWS